MSTTMGMNPVEPTIPVNDGIDGIDRTTGGVPGAGIDTQEERRRCDEPSVLTLVLVTLKGALVDIEEAWQEMKGSEKSKEIVCRLVFAEDLPRTTERLLEFFGGDCRILIDHAANKSDHDLASWEEQRSREEFHMNISEDPAAISIALPYEIHGTTELSGDERAGRVDLRLAKENSQRLSLALRYPECHTLGTAWDPCFPCGHNVQYFLHIALQKDFTPICPRTLSRLTYMYAFAFFGVDNLQY